MDDIANSFRDRAVDVCVNYDMPWTLVCDTKDWKQHKYVYHEKEVIYNDEVEVLI